MSVSQHEESDADRSSRPSAAVCIHCGLSAGAGMAAQNRRCSAARSARRRGLWRRQGGWRYDLASRREEPRLPARGDTGYTPPDHTAAGGRRFRPLGQNRAKGLMVHILVCVI